MSYVIAAFLIVSVVLLAYVINVLMREKQALRGLTESSREQTSSVARTKAKSQ